VHPAIYNAANEIAVQAFWDHRVGYLAISDVVAAVLADDDVPSSGSPLDVDDVLAADAWARDRAEQMLARASRSADGEARGAQLR